MDVAAEVPGQAGPMRNSTPMLGGAVAAALIAALCGCLPVDSGCESDVDRTVYCGWESDIDGVLWRQVAAHEDPLWTRLGQPRSVETYLDDTEGTVWDGVTDPSELGVARGAVLFYDVDRSGSRYEFGVFISSGPRPDVLTDEGDPYRGPSQVFTCFTVIADIVPLPQIERDRDDWRDGIDLQAVAVDRDVDVECPSELVAEMPPDAAFAFDDVFDG